MYAFECDLCLNKKYFSCFFQIPVPAFILVCDGERGRGQQSSALHAELSFSKQAFYPEGLLVILTCSLLRIQLCLEKLGVDEVVVVRRSLRFNPSKFLHKSSCRLSLLSFNLVNNL